MSEDEERQIASGAIEAWRKFHGVIECVPSSNSFVKWLKIGDCTVRIEIRKGPNKLKEGS